MQRIMHETPDNAGIPGKMRMIGVFGVLVSVAYDKIPDCQEAERCVGRPDETNLIFYLFETGHVNSKIIESFRFTHLGCV